MAIRSGTHETTDGRHWDWITNSPEASKALKLADCRYAQAQRQASLLPLSLKVVAIRKARAERQSAYQAAAAS